jgi:hypothetical protein
VIIIKTDCHTPLPDENITAIYSWVTTTVTRRNAPTNREAGVQNDSLRTAAADKFEVVGKTYWKLRHRKTLARPR